MKSRLLCAAAFSAVSVLFLAPATAAPSPSAETDGSDLSSASGGKMRALAFHGNIASVDETARTFTIAGKQTSRSFTITDTTLITKAGQPATMKDVVANEEVRGSYYKMGDGRLEAKTLKLGPLTEAEKAEKEARKERREAKKAAASATP